MVGEIVMVNTMSPPSVVVAFAMLTVGSPVVALATLECGPVPLALMAETR